MRYFCPCPTCNSGIKLTVRSIHRHHTNHGLKVTLGDILRSQPPQDVNADQQRQRLDADHQQQPPKRPKTSSDGSPHTESATANASSATPDRQTVQQGPPTPPECTSPPTPPECTSPTIPPECTSPVREAEVVAVPSPSSDQSSMNFDSGELGDDTDREPSTVLGKLDQPLYYGAGQTLREALTKYIRTFINKTMSKECLSEFLQSTASILPQPNIMPINYKQVRTLLSHELLSLHAVDICANDCLMFTHDNSELTECSECRQPRYKVDQMGRKSACRQFQYVDIKQFLSNMFGCSNIAQILHECTGVNRDDSVCGILTDIHDTALWKEWMTAGLDTSTERKVVLGLNTDGVNPFHSSTSTQYSFWPLIFCVLNLPKHIRTKSEALLLFGIMPSRKDRLGKGIEPNIPIYQELLVSELLKLISTDIFSAYSRAPLTVKVELLLYMSDIQAYSKYFMMSGAVSYMPCHLCMFKAQRSRTNTKMVMLGHASYANIQQKDYQEECSHRQRYDQIKGVAAQSHHARKLGVKGQYADLQLPYHNRIDSATVDAMHTIKNVIYNIMEVVRGKKSFRCPSLELGDHELSVADARFTEMYIPEWVDLPKQTTIITRPKGMKSHDWKQLVHHRIVIYLLHGLFRDSGAEATLFTLLDCIAMLYTEKVDVSCWNEDVTVKLISAIAQFELLCPNLMNITTHLLIHQSELMVRYGPVHSTWLFPYERFNGWLSSRLKRRSCPEAALIQTYLLNEWCARQCSYSDIESGKPRITYTHTALRPASADVVCKVRSLNHGDIPADDNLFVVDKVCVDGKCTYFGGSTTIVLCESEFLRVEDIVATTPLPADVCESQHYRYIAICALMQPIRMEEQRRNELFHHLVGSTNKRVHFIEKLSKPLVYVKSEENLYTIINVKP